MIQSEIVFRKYFCSICIKYNCNVHYFKVHNITTIDKGIKLLNKNIVKNSLNLEFTNVITNRNNSRNVENIEIDYEKYLKCKDCARNHGNKMKEITPLEIYIMQIYFDIFENNCIISNLLYPKISCLYVKNTRDKIKQNKIGYLNLSNEYALKLNVIDASKIKPSNKKYLDIQDYPEYEPCSHEGLCNLENCKCISSM